eukprot:scaffold1525_cov142-Cylindrotheca_fusiformis.AAC.177
MMLGMSANKEAMMTEGTAIVVNFGVDEAEANADSLFADLWYVGLVGLRATNRSCNGAMGCWHEAGIDNQKTINRRRWSWRLYARIE